MKAMFLMLLLFIHFFLPHSYPFYINLQSLTRRFHPNTRTEKGFLKVQRGSKLRAVLLVVYSLWWLWSRHQPDYTQLPYRSLQLQFLAKAVEDGRWMEGVASAKVITLSKKNEILVFFVFISYPRTIAFLSNDITFLKLGQVPDPLPLIGTALVPSY